MIAQTWKTEQKTLSQTREAQCTKEKFLMEMLRWKREYAPHYALFLKGAGRVGKTTLAEKLGKEAYKSYILVRFDQANDEIRDLLINGLRELDTLFAALQLIYGKNSILESL